MKRNDDTIVYSLIEKKYNHDASGKNIGLDHVLILDIFDDEETAYACIKTKCVEFEKNPCRMTYGYFASGVKNDGYYYEYMVISHLVVPRVSLKTIEIKTEYLDEKTLEKTRLFDEYTFYGNMNLTKEWYKMRYKSYHSIFTVYDNSVTFCDGTCKFIGYIAAIPITKELYDTISSGIIYDDINVNPNMFLKQSQYVYIPSIVLDEKYRNLGIGSMLFKKVLEKYNNHFLCGITISKNGFNLFKKYMQHKCNIMKDHDVFILDNTKNHE